MPRRDRRDEGGLLQPPMGPPGSTRSRPNSAGAAAVVAGRASPYLGSSAFAASSSSLGNMSRTGEQSIVPVGTQPVSAVDAPFLATAEAHLGRMTLTAPDNMRRRKQEEKEKRQKARKRKMERADAAAGALMAGSVIETTGTRGGTMAAAGAATSTSSVPATISNAYTDVSRAGRRPPLTITRSTSNLQETQRSRSPTRPQRPRSAQNTARSDTSPERAAAGRGARRGSGGGGDPVERHTRRRRVASRAGATPSNPITDQSRRSSEQMQDTAEEVRAEALRRATQRRGDIYADLSSMGLPGASDSEPDDGPPPFPTHATRPPSPPPLPAEGEEWTEDMRRRQEEYMTNRPPDSPPPAFLSDGEGAVGQMSRPAESSPDQSSDEGAEQTVISEERRLWEEDVATGYSFEERVERERKRREGDTLRGMNGETLPVAAVELSDTPTTVLPNTNLGQLVMEARARRRLPQNDAAHALHYDRNLTATSSAGPTNHDGPRAKAIKKQPARNDSHRRTVSDGQTPTVPSQPQLQPSTSNADAPRNAAIGTGTGLVNDAHQHRPVISPHGKKVTAIRSRPASDSHSRFRDDASAAANRRLALWGPTVGASGEGSTSQTHLFDVVAPSSLRSKSATDVGQQVDSNDVQRSQPTRGPGPPLRRQNTSSSSGGADGDRDSSDSDAEWEKEEKRFNTLQQKVSAAPVVVDSSDEEDAARKEEMQLPGSFLPGAVRRRAASDLPELGKIGSTVPRAPPPLALGRSRGGAAYSSSSASSTDSDANRLQDEEDETDSDSPPEMDEAVSMGEHAVQQDATPPASSVLLDKGKQPARSLPDVPPKDVRSEASTSSVDLCRAGTFVEDSGSSHEFSDGKDYDEGDAHASSRPAVQNRLKELFAAQLASRSLPYVGPSSGPKNASERSLDLPSAAHRRSDERRPSASSRRTSDSMYEEEERKAAGRRSDDRREARLESVESLQSAADAYGGPSTALNERQARSEALTSISQLQRSQQALPAGVDRSSLAALERMLARTAPDEPLTAEPSKLTRSGAIGKRPLSTSFVNPRTVNAPRPLGRLPTITDATRHFPAAERPTPSPNTENGASDSFDLQSVGSGRTVTRPLSTIGTPSWMAYIPQRERRALPDPIEPDLRLDTRPRVPSPTRGSRVFAMVERFEQQQPTEGDDLIRPSSPVRRLNSRPREQDRDDETLQPAVPLRRKPPPPPPTSAALALAAERRVGVAARDLPMPPAASSSLPFAQKLPHTGAQARTPLHASYDKSASHTRSPAAADPTAAGDYYATRLPPAPPRSLQSPPSMNAEAIPMATVAMSPTQPPTLPRPSSGEPISIFGNLYSAEERSRSSGNLFGSRPLPTPPQLNPSMGQRRATPPAIARLEERLPTMATITTASPPLEEQIRRRTDSFGREDAELQRDDRVGSLEPFDSPTSIVEAVEPEPTSVPANRGPAAQPSRRAPSLGYTDLDLFASRLADVRAEEDGAADDDADAEGSGEHRDTYDDLHLLAEFLGPAKAPGLTQEQMETLPVGRVEVLRRRVVGKRDDGRDKVKLALAVTGVKVERCGICLVQFKEGNLACVFPCLHIFHEQCSLKLLRSTKVCPICRTPVIET